MKLSASVLLWNVRPMKRNMPPCIPTKNAPMKCQQQHRSRPRNKKMFLCAPQTVLRDQLQLVVAAVKTVLPKQLLRKRCCHTPARLSGMFKDLTWPERFVPFCCTNTKPRFAINIPVLALLRFRRPTRWIRVVIPLLHRLKNMLQRRRQSLQNLRHSPCLVALKPRPNLHDIKRRRPHEHGQSYTKMMMMTTTTTKLIMYLLSHRLQWKQSRKHQQQLRLPANSDGMLW
mmetsp:Transcript_11671/g.22316  ORF Transcript_11671/g.22316 Transcript_11671/m.22316 type:complete len:229 (-) Transcript_11671:955-1641(-)